jgi:hypothetical protein
LVQIIDFGELPVFQNAATFPAIFITRNIIVTNQEFQYSPIKQLSFSSLDDEAKRIGILIDSKNLGDENWTMSDDKETTIFQKMKDSGKCLGEYVNNNIFRGVLTGLNAVFVIDNLTKDKLLQKDPKSKEIIKPFLLGDDIRKYRINYQNKYLIFTRRGIDIKQYPAVFEYLKDFKSQLTPKPKEWQGSTWEGRKPGPYQWYEIQDTIGYFPEFEKDKIIFPDIAKESRMSYDKTGYFVANTAYIIPTNDLYLLGILNSKLIFFFYKRIASVLGDADKGGRLRWIFQDVVKIPIRTINLSDPVDKARHDRMVALVTQMLDLNKKLQDAKLEHEKTLLSRQVAVTDAVIDKLVYELYGLTEEEIRIVERG